MTTAAYLTGRRRYQRPQGILWSENAGTLVNGVYVPTGHEVGVDSTGLNADDLNQFLILSDHNRGELNFNQQRIEQRQRTINGRMRSYHVADKISMDVSWSMLPSRGYPAVSSFNSTSGAPLYTGTNEYTSDGGAGGVELLDWYEGHPGPFWMYLSYDKYSNFKTDEEITDASFGHLAQYNQIIQVYFSNFNYSVVKRGGNNLDLWNISVSLEEV